VYVDRCAEGGMLAHAPRRVADGAGAVVRRVGNSEAG
jgi:hypothetical protein